jgi:hypothetical protein
MSVILRQNQEIRRQVVHRRRYLGFLSHFANDLNVRLVGERIQNQFSH